MLLADLKVNEWGTVKTISVRGAQRQRLLDLGLVPGTKIMMVFASPRGNPVAYLVRGAIIALRLDTARLIILY